MSEGHCGLPVEELTTLAAKLLEVPDDLIATALALELEAGEVVADLAGWPSLCVPRRPVPGRTDHRRTAAGLAVCQAILAAHRRRQGDPMGGARDWSAVGRKPDARRCGLALSSKVLVITGGPGVGKTTWSIRS